LRSASEVIVTIEVINKKTKNLPLGTTARADHTDWAAIEPNRCDHILDRNANRAQEKCAGLGVGLVDGVATLDGPSVTLGYGSVSAGNWYSSDEEGREGNGNESERGEHF
jgi:hypothetical protein